MLTTSSRRSSSTATGKMGLFHKKPKAPRSFSKASLGGGDSTTSVNSDLKSPATATHRPLNRSSAGSIPQTPLTPFSPAHLPKVDMPRAPDPQLDPAGYLRSLGSVRERSKIVTEKAFANRLNHFDVDMTKFPDVVHFVCGIIKRDYDAPLQSTIPPHGQHQHFNFGGRDRIASLLSTFPDNVDQTEKCRRLIDLFLVSKLLDVGAGTHWTFKSSENGRFYRRAEGLAVASLEMFKAGLFSSRTNKFQADKHALKAINVDKLAQGMQSRPGNVAAGLEDRVELLVHLGNALSEHPEFFGEDGRPGNMVDYILSHPTTQASSMPIVVLPVLWNVLMTGLSSVWPVSRTAINGVPLGDAWPCSAMPQSGGSPISAFPSSHAPWEAILPLHKLTQYLTYSLMQPMQSLLKIHFAGAEMLTGLPDYRNGGLFVDLGVLSLKKHDMQRGLQYYNEYVERTGRKGVEVAPVFEPNDDVVVEWRGVTIGLLDRLLIDVNRALSNELQGGELTMAQLLEAGSWRGGIEIAEVSRPNTKEPPILVDSDGAVFKLNSDLDAL